MPIPHEALKESLETLSKMLKHSQIPNVNDQRAAYNLIGWFAIHSHWSDKQFALVRLLIEKRSRTRRYP